MAPAREKATPRPRARPRSPPVRARFEGELGAGGSFDDGGAGSLVTVCGRTSVSLQTGSLEPGSQFEPGPSTVATLTVVPLPLLGNGSAARVHQVDRRSRPDRQLTQRAGHRLTSGRAGRIGRDERQSLRAADR